MNTMAFQNMNLPCHCDQQILRLHGKSARQDARATVGRAFCPDSVLMPKMRKPDRIGLDAGATRVPDRLTRPLRHTLLAVTLLAAPLLHADVYTLSAPHYSCNAGAVVSVPINLDHATGVAGIRMQVNYDPQVLILTNVQAGPLGAQFAMSNEIADGSVTIDLVRATPLTTGAGRLALLRFVTNAGATTDLYSDLALARFEIGDETGVRDLAVAHTLAVRNGSVSVSLSANIDNESNGLPDWWELQYGLDLFAPAIGRDNDGDALDNLLEYAFGGNPLIPDAGQAGPFSNIQNVDGHPYLTLTFLRRKPPATVNYLLQECPGLDGWSSINPDLRLAAPTIDLGNGMERVTARSEFPLDAPEAPIQSFMRIAVEPQR